MAVDPKATEKPTEDSFSFGGAVPHIPDAPVNGPLSIVDEEPVTQKLDISGTNENRPPLGEDLRNQRTDKIRFGLGEDSPGPEVIQQKLLNGQEDDLRQIAAEKADLKDKDLKLQVVKDKASRGDTNGLEELIKFTPQNNPDTIFEKHFADRYVPIAESLKSGDNVIANSRKVNDEHVFSTEEIARKMVEKQEIAKFAQEDEHTHYENLGFGAKAWEFGKMLLPGYDWYKTYNVVKGTPSDSYLQGSNWADQIHHLYTLPSGEMQTALRETLKGLRESDPRLALEFASAVVHYTSTDAFIHNAGNILDVAQLPGTAKGAYKLVRGAANIAENRIARKEVENQVVQAYKDHVAANSANGSMGDMFAKMGDLDKAATLKATEKAKEVLTAKGGMTLARDDIRSLLPSVFNPEAILADGSNLSAKQSLDLLSRLTYNASTVLEKVNNLQKVGRLPEEALQVAIQEAKDSLKNRFKHLNDTVVDVKFEPKPVDETKLMGQIEAKYGKVDWTPDGKELPPTKSAIAEPNKALEDKLSAKIEAKTGKPIPGEKELIQDFEVVRPEQTATNTGSVTALLGDKDGNSFKSLDHAMTWARLYGLDLGDFRVHQRGVGFYIAVTKNFDETTEGVRSALTISTKTKTPSHLSRVTGYLKSGNGRLSEFQNENRITATSSQQGLVAALKDMHKDLTALNRKERSALSRVMDDNHTALKDPESGEVGVFHRTVKEFSANFERINGRQPSLKETKAYFTAVQINDLEYMLRNNSLYRELSRLGLQNFKLKVKSVENGVTRFKETQKFYGKYVDNLPLQATDAKHPARVAIYKEGEEPEFYELSLLNTPERLQKIEEMKAEGYKIIQTGVPNRKPGSEVFGEDPVNFIVTKDHISNVLEHDPLPYKEGWHQEYPHQWFVKQPLIRRVDADGKTHHVYEGDVTSFAFHTEAEARKYASAMEEARLILKGEKKGNLSEFLEKNLPYSERKFTNLFYKPAEGGKEPYFNINDSFFHVPSGTSLIDSSVHRISERYQNFNDTIRSPWNLYDQIDKKFVGQRDPLVHTVKEKGTEANPVFQLATAETIDPMASLSRAMTNMVRNQFMLDYRTQAVESWMAEFSHLLADANHVSEQDLYANALHYLYNGKLKIADVSDKAAIDSAELSRMAIKEFLGNSMSDVTGIDSFKNGLMNTVYSNFGQGVSNYLAPKILAAEVDPVRALRSFAFHTTIGMFNPIQWWQNAQTMANAFAIGGLKSGSAGFAAGHMWQFLRLNQTDGVVSRLAKISGWKEEHFKEAWQAFKDSGRFSIEGEHAWKDDLADHKFYTYQNSLLGDAKKLVVSTLDKGTIFFREGDRMARMTAYATAYHEWRLANPSAVLSAEAKRAILKRSDDMTVNMSRASMAAWQQGVFSLPTQFLSYNARIMEQLLGKTLTGQEKARLLMVNSALYGVPIGLTMPLAGIYNPWEDVRGYFLKKGWNVDDKVFDAVNNGIMGLTASMITGRPNSLSERSGPGGTNFFRDIVKGDKQVWELLTGAAGTKAAEAYQASLPFVKFVASAAMGKPEEHPIFVSDAIDLLRTAKSFDDATKLYIALTTGNLITKSGMNYGEINTPEALLMAATGGVPRKITDEQLMLTLGKDRQEAHKQIEKEIIKLHQKEIQAMANHDEETFKALRSRIKSLWIIGNFRPDEMGASLQRVYDAVNPAGDKIRYEWVFKNADPDEIQDRANQYFKGAN